MRVSTRSAAVAIAFLLAAPPALAVNENAKRSYRDGLAAMEDQDWERAARKLREAIKADPTEGTYRGTGVSFEDYAPHLYLGLALEKLSRAVEAERELEESQRQGKSLENRRLAAQLQAALARVRPLAVAQARPTPTPTPLPLATATPRPAQPTVPIPTSTPVPPRPVPTLPRRTAVPTAPLPIPTSPVPAPPIPTPRPTLVPIPPPEPRGSSDEILADLKAGIRAYFHGDYDGAIRLLEKRRDASGTARLFLAYSLAGKYLLEGPSADQKILTRARDEFRAAQLAGAPVREDRLISKSVRTILERG